MWVRLGEISLLLRGIIMWARERGSRVKLRPLWRLESVVVFWGGGKLGFCVFLGCGGNYLSCFLLG